ncbi:MAG TPA: hypothetical protein VM865_05075 [Acidobacteriaceae bacterium]|jgi:hypothetical protein|nr:hypothetical protein [Acidobacteriaceae bacterium]
MPETKPLPATDSAVDLRNLVKDDATAEFETDPKFVESNPVATASSENLAAKTVDDDEDEVDDEDEDDDELEDDDEDEDVEDDDEDEVDDEDDDEEYEDDDEDEDVEDDEDEDEVGTAAAWADLGEWKKAA